MFSEEEWGYSFKDTRRKEYECGMCKLEKDGRKKRIEIEEKVNVLVAELEREKKCYRKGRGRSWEFGRGGRYIKGKVEEVKKEVIVRPKTRVEGSRSRNRIEQVGLNNDRVRSEEGRMKKGEWTKVKGGKSKKVESLKCINVKNMFSVLDQIDEEKRCVGNDR